MVFQNPQYPQVTQMVQEKKLSGWVKFLIVFTILGVLGLIMAGVGFFISRDSFRQKGGPHPEESMKHSVGKTMEKGMEQAGTAEKSKVDLTDKGLVIKDEKTGQEIAIQTNRKLPDGFPPDIPVFLPSQVTGSMSMGSMTMVTFDTVSSLTDVSNFYQKELIARGWRSDFTVPPSGTSYSGLFKKGNLALTVSVNQEGDRTSWVLSYGSE